MAENQGNETGKGAKRPRRQLSAVEKRRLLVRSCSARSCAVVRSGLAFCK